MIPKSTLAKIVLKQRKGLEDRNSGQLRHILPTMPYLTDRALLIGGVRGSGRSTLLLQMLENDYPQAWYTDFSDARLAGFDSGDFIKLSALIAESGKGILLLDKLDQAQGWVPFVTEKLAEGIKVVATVSLDTMLAVQRGQQAMAAGEWLVEDPLQVSQYIIRKVGLFSYSEFLEATHKRGGEEAVEEYLLRGAFPECCKPGRTASLLSLYDLIVNRDVLIAKGVRDRVTLARIALYLLTATDTGVTANAIRNQLKVKAVSTVTEHMEHLERAGLVSFVPILGTTPGRQAVNPRRVYAVDTAMAIALSLDELSRESLFSTLIYNHIANQYDSICYTSEQGGCDFVASGEGLLTLCVQACWEADDPDLLQNKIDGLRAAMALTGVQRGVIVTLNRSERISVDEGEIEIVEADAFLSE
mgnify:FL=1